MSSLEDMRHLAEEVVAAYASRLVTVSEVISEAYDLLNRGRAEREMIGVKLRDLLATGNSLRRKDFDRIIGSIFSEQNEREETVKAQLQKFLQDQGKLAEQLKEVLQTGDLARVRSIRTAIEKGLTETKQMLSDFHNEERVLMRRFKLLMERGSTLTVPEFKAAVSEIKNDLKVWTESAL